MNVRFRLLSVLNVVGVLFMVYAGVVAYLSIAQSHAVDRLIGGNSAAIGKLHELVVQLEKTRRFEKEYFIYVGHTSKKAKYVSEWSESMERVFAILSTLKEDPQQLFDADKQTEFTSWLGAIRFYDAEFRKIVDSYQHLRLVGSAAEDATSRYTVDANAAIADGKNRLRTVFDGAERTLGDLRTELAEARADVQTRTDRMVYLVFGVSLLLLAILIVGVRGLHSSFMAHFYAILAKVSLLRDGDKSMYFDKTGVAELDRLSHDLEQIKTRLIRCG